MDYFTAKEVYVHSDESIRTNVDGEKGPALPIDIRVMPGYLRVIVPEKTSDFRPRPDSRA